MNERWSFVFNRGVGREEEGILRRVKDRKSKFMFFLWNFISQIQDSHFFLSSV